MDLVVGREQCAVTDKTDAFDLSRAAAEIGFRLGDDDVGVKPLGRHFGLNEFLEWIAADEIDRRNRRILDRGKSGALIADRLHLKTAAQCRACLLDDEVVKAPGSDRK